MANEVLNKFIDRLTDRYDKTPGGGVYELAQLMALKIQENEDALHRIGAWRDIDQAQGAALNLLGQNVRQNRGQSTDEVYRVLIKSKIKRNLSNGSINTLIDFLAFILQIPAEQVTVEELWDKGAPGEIKVDVPSGATNITGLSRNQFGTFINLVVAAGIKANVLFEGTFRFSKVYDASETGVNGFSNNAGTSGGTLGDAYDPANDYELPI